MQQTVRETIRQIETFQDELGAGSERLDQSQQVLPPDTGLSRSKVQIQCAKDVEKIQFEFSKFLKHKDIVIKDKMQSYNSKYSSQYKIQLLQPTLENGFHKVQQWSIQVVEATPNWIGFGIGHIEHIKKQDYQYNKKELLNYSQVSPNVSRMEPDISELAMDKDYGQGNRF